MASTRMARRLLVALVTIALVGCSGGDGQEATTPAATTPSEASSDQATSQASTPAAPAEQAGTPAAVANSRATVTVDGETWEFSPFFCAVGAAQTRSDTYSFSSDGSAAGEGDIQLQFQVSVRDPSGQDRLLGDGVVYEFTLYDWGSDTPTVDFSGQATQGVTIGPGTLAVDGEFTSIDGDTYTVVVDAVCAG